MEWLEKIPQWIKIPLKILLPALCLFSGFLLLISDNLADKLYLKTFRDKNGFVFGIIFLITLSLILCYFISFILPKIKNFFFRKKLIKRFLDLEDIHKSILYQIYRKPTKTMIMEINRGVVVYLMNLQAIGHGQIPVGGFAFEFYLQPWVNWGIEYEIKQCKKDINKFEKRESKLKKLSDYNDLKECYESYKKFIKYIESVDEGEQNG